MSRVKLVGTTSLAVLLSATAVGQYSPFSPAGPSPVYQQHKSYSDYYNEQLHTYQQPRANVQQYTYDKYFYHSPNISPYLKSDAAHGCVESEQLLSLRPARRAAAQSGRECAQL